MYVTLIRDNLELAPSKIRVNVFQPAGMDTDMIHELADGLDKTLQKDGIFNQVMTNRTPTKSLYMPTDECINTMLFLMSDLTTQLTGVNLTLDGGYLCT